MSENLKIALKLTLICFIAVLLLSTVNICTQKKIAENENKVENLANKELFQQGAKFEKKEFKNPIIDKTKEYFYNVYNSQNAKIGYIISVMANGYGGEMKLMVALNNSLEIVNVKLLKNSETPGIGKNAEKSEYMKKFIGTNTKEKPLPQKKNDLSSEDSDSITGATITFNAIANGIKRSIDLITEEQK